MHLGFWHNLRRVIAGLTIVYLLAPLVIIAILSFSSAPFLTFPPPGFSLKWYAQIWNDPEWSGSILTSVTITIPAALFATVVGTGAAVAISRGTLRLPTILSGAVMMPLVVPVIVAAASISASFGAWGLQGRYIGLVIAHVVLTIPYVFSVTRAALQAVNADVEGAALTLGASPMRVLMRVTVPMIMPAVISGFLFAAVVSFGELVVSMFLSTPEIRPVAVQMWSNVRGSVDPTIAAVATSIFVVTVVILLIEHAINRRR